MPRRKKTQPIGKRLLKLRREKKLTLKHLGNETGLSTKYISQVEKGEVTPRSRFFSSFQGHLK